MLKKSDFMLEQEIITYFSKPPFNNKKYPIFETDCEDDHCKINFNFEDYIILNGDNIKILSKSHEKSVDRIFFLKNLWFEVKINYDITKTLSMLST